MKSLNFIVYVLSIFFLVSCNQKKIDTVSTDSNAQDSIDFAKSNGKLSPEILWKFGRINPDIQLSPDKTAFHLPCCCTLKTEAIAP